MESELGGEIKDGTYVRTSLGSGIYYVNFGIIVFLERWHHF